MPEDSDNTASSANQPSHTDSPATSLATQLRHLRELISDFRDWDGRDRALLALNREIQVSLSNEAASQARPVLEQQRRSMQPGSDNPRTRARSPTRPRLRQPNYSNRLGSPHPDSSAMTEPRRRLTDTDLSALRSAEERLLLAGSTIRNMLEDNSTTLDPPHGASERSLVRRRNKRVKLDSDDKREGIRGFNYGHYGQVVPGALELDIVTVDGGVHGMEGRNSWPENMLINDNTLYCVRNPRCNIILKHHGQTPFCLKRLVIKAPKSGLNGPSGVREGMVFVSMASDDLMTRTAEYHMLYHRLPYSTIQLSSLGSENMQTLRSGSRILERTLLVHPERSAYDRGQYYEVPDGRPNQEFHVTMEQDDKSENESIIEDTFPYNLETTDDVMHGVFPPDIAPADYQSVLLDDSDSSDSDSSANILDDLRRHMRGQGHLDPALEVRRRLLPPGAASATTDTANESAPLPDEPVLVPHARFFIRKDKSTVNIMFDPPVSGRFLLIKLWTPFGNGVVEVQNISAYGFAGPRFFPSLELR